MRKTVNVAILLFLFLTGCRAYLGSIDYSETDVIDETNHKFVKASYDIVHKDGKIKIKETQTIAFEMVMKTKKGKTWLCHDPDFGDFLLYNTIGLPFRVIGGCTTWIFALCGAEDNYGKYKGSMWRMWWRCVNPFTTPVCESGKIIVDETISTETWNEPYKKEKVINSGEHIVTAHFVSQNKSKQIQTPFSKKELCGMAFDYSLPEKAEIVRLTYKTAKPQNISLKSTDFVSISDLELWKRIQAVDRNSALAREKYIIKKTNDLVKRKIISPEAGQTQIARIQKLAAEKRKEQERIAAEKRKKQLNTLSSIKSMTDADVLKQSLTLCEYTDELFKSKVITQENKAFYRKEILTKSKAYIKQLSIDFVATMKALKDTDVKKCDWKKLLDYTNDLEKKMAILNIGMNNLHRLYAAIDIPKAVLEKSIKEWEKGMEDFDDLISSLRGRVYYKRIITGDMSKAERKTNSCLIRKHLKSFAQQSEWSDEDFNKFWTREMSFIDGFSGVHFGETEGNYADTETTESIELARGEFSKWRFFKDAYVAVTPVKHRIYKIAFVASFDNENARDQEYKNIINIFSKKNHGIWETPFWKIDVSKKNHWRHGKQVILTITDKEMEKEVVNEVELFQ